MSDLDAQAMSARDNAGQQEALIHQYQPFILKCASDFSKRYITHSDDEWSIALSGFSEAISKYSAEQGSFLGFAKMVIHRRLVDYFKSNNKFRKEITVSPSMFSGDAEEDEAATDIYLQVKEELVCEIDRSAADEIEAANDLLKNYGFSFFDLTACSPKSAKTKTACAKAVVFIIKNPILMNEMQTTKLLPINIISKNTDVPRKILERHRKYIIAVAEILSGEYPCLHDYLQPIREELNK